MDDTDRHKHSDAHPAELTPTEARQGSSRSMTLRVLVIGTLLVVFAGFAIGMMFYGPADNQPLTQSAPPVVKK